MLNKIDDESIAIITGDDPFALADYISMFKANGIAYIERHIPGDDEIKGFWMLTICEDKADEFALDIALIQSESSGVIVTR